jgi:hypothetical protein
MNPDDRKALLNAFLTTIKEAMPISLGHGNPNILDDYNPKDADCFAAMVKRQPQAPVTFEIIKKRDQEYITQFPATFESTREYITRGTCYATDSANILTNRVDNSAYRMRALGFRTLLNVRAPL